MSNMTFNCFFCGKNYKEGEESEQHDKTCWANKETDIPPGMSMYACCSKAKKKRNCVCMLLVVCPEHGSKHIGTHE